MNRRFRRIASALSSCAIAVGSVIVFSGSASAATVTTPVTAKANTPGVIDILNINDFHGRIDTDYTGTLGKAFACSVASTRAKFGADNTLFLAAGDNIGASPFTSSSQDDKPTLGFLNALGLQASSVGNHEFDKGVQKLLTIAGAQGQYPYLAANVYTAGTTDPILPSYTIISANGLKVGVIGAVTQETPSLTGPNSTGGVDFGDPVAAVNRVADQLTDEDPDNGEADVLIAEFHEGASEGTPEGASLAEEVAAGGAFANIVNNASNKVSAIFTGHTHKEYAWDAPVPGGDGTRPILQAASYASRLGHVQLTFDPTTKALLSYSLEEINTPATAPAAGEPCLADPQYQAAASVVDAAAAEAKVIGSQPIGNVTADITTAFSEGVSGDRSRESALSNLIAQSMVDVLKAPGRSGADIGLMNPGGVRTDLLFNDGVDNTGVITYGEAAAIVPFANTLQTIELTGAQLKKVLEQQWQPAGSSRPFLKLGLSKNLSYTFNPDAATGSHITSVSVDGVPLDMAKSYVVVGSSFLIGGGDNFTEIAKGAALKDSGLIDTDAFIDYVKTQSPLSPNFARGAVAIPDQPATATAGQQVSFNTAGWDLTSLGSPANTQVQVFLGDTKLATLPVSAGAAAIAFTVPADVTAGTSALKLVAAPSLTTATFPVEIKAATTVTLPVTPPVTPPAAQPAVSLDKGSYAPGESVTVTATGFPAGAVATVEFRSTPVVLGTLTIGADGSAAAVFTVPVTASAGGHQIVVSAAGVSASVSLSVAGGTLAATGTDSAPMLGIAGILLALGGGLMIAGRRRFIGSV